MQMGFLKSGWHLDLGRTTMFSTQE